MMYVCEKQMLFILNYFVVTVINCGGLCNPDKGTVLISSSTAGGVATYYCNTGYELEGNSRRECQSDGDWSGTDPTCQGII